MKTIGILQPGYLPWLGFFEQLDRADLFVIYDDVQYDKNGWRNRNRIKTSQGIQWLTVPVIIGTSRMINDILIDNRQKWQKKHLKSIEQNYRKSPYFEKYFHIFEEGFLSKWERLIDCDTFFIEKLKEALGINTPIIFSSDLKSKGKSVDRLVKILIELGGNAFYEGIAGKDYIDEKFFNEAGIKLIYQDYNHPEYNQMYGQFVPYLSVVDLIFNEGDESLKIIRSGIN